MSAPQLVRGYEVVIGLETHAQLSTRSKIFSGSSTQFGAEPNTQASVVDLAAVGSADAVRRQLGRYLDAGATEVLLSPLAWADRAVSEELWALAASIPSPLPG